MPGFFMAPLYWRQINNGIRMIAFLRWLGSLFAGVLTGFARFQLGEGIDRGPQGDFAAEVAAAAGVTA